MVTVKSYNNPIEANIDKARLESEGLLVFLKNENSYMLSNLYGMNEGGIELQVEATEVEIAREFLGIEEILQSRRVNQISQKLNRANTPPSQKDGAIASVA